jgi:cell division protein FtsI (penicillin-binding protein 3)
MAVTGAGSGGGSERAQGRLVVLALFFGLAFATVGAKMATLAVSGPLPGRGAPPEAIVADRADIVDREGRLLATNMATVSLYAQPPQMVDPARAARELAAIFPDLDSAELERRFTDGRRFLWIKRTLSPEQRQAVHDLGEPGLLFGPREMRLYPNGRLMAHVLGGASFGQEGVGAAEVIGVAGVERHRDERLRATPGEPLRLSLDLTIQAAVEEVLAGGMRLMNAKGASAVLMHARTGEIVSLASLPDFDPNDRPAPLTEGDQGNSPLFNRALQGVYELGSVFKTLTVAQALELGLVRPGTLVDTKGPIRQNRFTIRDFRDYGPYLPVTEVLVRSSNIGTARLALEIGGARQEAFLSSLGLMEPTPVELVEARRAAPMTPSRWPEITQMTVSYGHGIAVSPVHLAAAYASVLNGGTRVRPTLLDGAGGSGERVVSQAVSASVRGMLREVVTRGTASFGQVPGWALGGKTGTADKPKPTGGYHEDKVIATFASVFPVDDPAYVLIVTLDEPEERGGDEPRRTAGWTAVPVAAEIVRRVAPLLGLHPEWEAAPG